MAEQTLIYLVLGEPYRTVSVEVGAAVEPIKAPDVEGYDFISWENIPERMPKSSVTVTANLKPDSYTLTEMVDEEVYATHEFSSGTDLSELPLPEKEGYTFTGWQKKYKKMPKSNLTLRGNFKINRYRLAFVIDDMTFERIVDFGTPLDFIVAPERDNHTFTGWGDLPATMPAHDLVLNGSFHVNQHTVTYILEGKPFHTDTYACGDPIKPAVVEQKEAHIFSGWRGLPKVMPDEDITIEGRYYQRKYKVSFMVDGKKFAWETVAEGDPIVPPDTPIKRGYVFVAWKGLPDRMPDHDMFLDAAFEKEKA